MNRKSEREKQRKKGAFFMLELKHIKKSFDGVPVLKNINLEIEKRLVAGSCVWILCSLWTFGVWYGIIRGKAYDMTVGILRNSARRTKV